MPSDLRTQAIVLRRTNYGESDRILNLLTPEGKISALARGVRKEKSRLAGGVELFTVADVVVHRGRSSLDIVTSAKMLRFYGNILSSIPSLELASSFLKQLDRAAEQADNPEFFDLLNQSLAGLNSGFNLQLVGAWFRLNLLRASGEEINLVRDSVGAPLRPDLRYFWDSAEQALHPNPGGNISAQEIKLARLILHHQLERITKINGVASLIPAITSIAR